MDFHKPIPAQSNGCSGAIAPPLRQRHHICITVLDQSHHYVYHRHTDPNYVNIESRGLN